MYCISKGFYLNDCCFSYDSRVLWKSESVELSLSFLFGSASVSFGIGLALSFAHPVAASFGVEHLTVVLDRASSSCVLILSDRLCYVLFRIFLAALSVNAHFRPTFYGFRLLRFWFRFRFDSDLVSVSFPHSFWLCCFLFFCHLLFAFVAFPHAEMLAGPRGVCAMLLRSCIFSRISHVSFGMCILALVDPIGNA